MLRGIPQRATLLIAHRNVGIACAILATALCALRSVLFKFVPHFYRFRLWNAWSAPRWHTVWISILITVVAIWFIHSILHLVSAFFNGQKSAINRRLYLGVSAVQISLVVAIEAYLVFVVASPAETFVVSETGTHIHGEFYRAVRIELNSNDPSHPRSNVVWLERKVSDVTESLRVARGKCFPSKDDKRQFMVVRARMSTDGAVFRHGHHRVELATEKSLTKGLDTLLFPEFRHPRHEHLNLIPHAHFKHGNDQTRVPLDPEWAGENALLGLKESPVILLRSYRNLSLSLALLAATSFFMTILLVRFRAYLLGSKS